MSSRSFDYDSIADQFIALVVEDNRIRALWAEAHELSALRRPYTTLELHLATDEPFF